MPLLASALAGLGRSRASADPSAPLFPVCAHPGCRSGRIHLWRNRSLPVLEGGWTCSPACTEARLRELVLRELAGFGDPVEPYRHRVPIGLVMLRHGWISRESLQQAVTAQRTSMQEQAEPLRIGEWLVQHAGLSEQKVAEALGLQWNCPVFPGDIDARVVAQPPLPRILMDACGVLPLRWTVGGALRLAFQSVLDHRLALAFERLARMPVEAGLLTASAYERCRRQLLGASFPRTRLLEAVSLTALVAALARQIERAQPVETRLVRYDHYLWMRMWLEPAEESRRGARTEDVIASLAEMTPVSADANS